MYRRPHFYASLALATALLTGWAGCGAESPETPADPALDTAQLAQSLNGPPTISSIDGSQWSYPACSNSLWEGSFQVAYTPRTRIPITVRGANLDQITSVRLSGAYSTQYVLTILSRSASALSLDLRATSENDSGSLPMTDAQMTFAWNTPTPGSVTKSMKFIPCLNVNNQCWGQCTWHVLMRRIALGLTEVSSYSQGRDLDGNPLAANFPRPNGVLMTAAAGHMAFLETVTQLSVTTTPSGEEKKYQLSGTQRNADCKGNWSRFSTTLVVNRSGTTWSVKTYPVVAGLKMAKVAN